ncbi:MAG TPA: hypothetical protein VFT99_06185 [Roseiflexaceae bacterium]|nr:hypothetical protein [Roseiflexaceae bacterium]
MLTKATASRRVSTAAGCHYCVLVLITDVHKGMIPALEYALSFQSDNVIAVHVDLEAQATEQLRLCWRQWELGMPLVVLPSCDGSLAGPLLQFVDQVSRCRSGDQTVVIIPECVSPHWWQRMLDNRAALFLKARLLFDKHTIVTSAPYYLDGPSPRT